MPASVITWHHTYSVSVPTYRRLQCCGSGRFISDPNFSIPDPGSRVKKMRRSQIRIRIKDSIIFTEQIVSKLSEIWSKMFIPDPDPGCGSATLLGYMFLQFLPLAYRYFQPPFFLPGRCWDQKERPASRIWKTRNGKMEWSHFLN